MMMSMRAIYKMIQRSIVVASLGLMERPTTVKILIAFWWSAFVIQSRDQVISYCADS